MSSRCALARGWTNWHVALASSSGAAEAGVAHTIETYPGAHGFAVPDNVGPYDEALAERHWAALAALYRSL